MIRALLAGRKTQTRRVVKPQPIVDGNSWQYYPKSPFSRAGVNTPFNISDMSPYGKPGDLLWVRETWMKATNFAFHNSPAHCIYRADGECIQKWKPSIFLPRWASRITLEITDVRVEKLQDTNESDAKAEGIFQLIEEPSRWINGKVNFKYSNPLSAFIGLWCAINGQLAWKENPWVWVIEFKVHQQNVDEFLKARAA